MKALQKSSAQPRLTLIDAPIPTINAHEVLIKIRKTTLCGTDISIYDWNAWAQKTIPVPLITGHEFMGEVVEVGAEVTEIKKGDRVSGEGHIACNHCRNCRSGNAHICYKTVGIGVRRQGCFAEYLALPATNVIQLPATISDDIGCILDPFGNAVHSTFSFAISGEDILITGAGPIGIMAAKLCAHDGARNIVVTDTSRYRLDLAQQMGATAVVDVSKESLEDTIKKIGLKEGFDVGLEMSGKPAAFHQMLDAVRNGASIASLGILPDDIVVPWSKIIFKGLTIKGIYGREMFETWYKVLHLLDSGLDISPVITHHFSYREFDKAFEIMKEGKSGKVILEWE
jgi:threonine 3-dehydrogenase